MAETHPSRPTLPLGDEEVLRLACPRCGGELHFKRRHLGVKGQCVHCRTSLVALEEASGIRAVGGDLSAPWGVPDPAFFPGAPSRPEALPGFAVPLPTREGDNLFGGSPFAPPSGGQSSLSPFGGAGNPSPLRPLFGGEGERASIAPAWGTRVPCETHASISPFGTGSADRGGLAESLFREKVEKDAGTIPGYDASAFPERPEGRSAKPFFEDARTEARRARLKRLTRTFASLSLLGGALVGAFFLLPGETLSNWKDKAVEWLEPGKAILDYLPEGMRLDRRVPAESGDAAGQRDM